ncbi:pyruvate ferredoxin oxidoreductase [Candidatus Bathyarchaeota archaeon]|nr:pyruvate ferredoxin oxidoreductase [Candidatus Bathyarchaeota archaeon]NIU80802.1 pyruvate ferredoxin oxidoreductase [Candidatus Bathyarchaeota archaeon]NIV67433.1 pyruvate ferredoxin oxidoreductase [Candidatus Bathyarchaeota archaeon]NIW15971.1 pyruvate ferredoxin oxidoreductase [Candidatus Bathyarchaeota archaeon]NIW34076.1 pyruvate ferredoxin oxidoreductase [Candidatus Bathyarchaeota archaeon]
MMVEGKQKMLALSGDEAVAYAVKQSDVDVVAAYPITPQTIIVERFSEYVHDGEVDTEFVCVESEHSALTACLSAAATGARTFTASGSAGLALMHEILYVTSGCRAPVVMSITNRALSAPINIHCDHADSMVERDASWIQIYAEDSQEAYDSIIQAFRIAEDPDILLPVMVMLDAFVLSHTLENVQVLTDENVRNFVGTRKIPLVKNHKGDAVPFKLDPQTPLTMGPLDLYDYYFEHKRQQEKAMENAPQIIKQVHDEYGEMSGRQYGNGLVDLYRMDDAELATICLGSTAGTTKTVVDQLRADGVKAGLLRLRTYRPFPKMDIIGALENVEAVAVMDRSHSFGAYGGPIFHEIRHILYDSQTRPQVVNYIYGLGGRDMPQKLIHQIYEELQRVASTRQVEETVQFIGVR